MKNYPATQQNASSSVMKSPPYLLFDLIFSYIYKTCILIECFHTFFFTNMVFFSFSVGFLPFMLYMYVPFTYLLDWRKKRQSAFLILFQSTIYSHLLNFFFINLFLLWFTLFNSRWQYSIYVFVAVVSLPKKEVQ